MKVYILDNGYLLMDKNLQLLNSVVATHSKPDVKCEMTKLPVMAVLIKHDQGNLLFDLGCNPKAGEPGYWPDRLRNLEKYCHEPEQELINQLAFCGVKPEDIDTVVFSHMHEDHTGNAELFSHARMFAPRREFIDALLSVHTNPDTGYIKREVMAPFREFNLIDEDFELYPGIEVINLPGHTNGLLGLVIRTEKDGVLIFPQDAVFCSESYGPPARLPGGFSDSVAYLNSVEKVRRLQKKYNAKVFFAHDDKAFKTYRHAPEFYE